MMQILVFSMVLDNEKSEPACYQLCYSIIVLDMLYCGSACLTIDIFNSLMLET